MQAWKVQTFRRTFHANPHSSALRGTRAWKVILIKGYLHDTSTTEVPGIELSQIVLGLICPGRLSGGGESQNEAKSRRFGIDMPCRAFYEGVNPKTIWDNCHESTGRRIGHFLTLHVRILFRSYEVPFLDCVECG